MMNRHDTHFQFIFNEIQFIMNENSILLRLLLDKRCYMNTRAIQTINNFFNEFPFSVIQLSMLETYFDSNSNFKLYKIKKSIKNIRLTMKTKIQKNELFFFKFHELCKV